jgi:tRNA-splicing ligase RtcB
VDPAVCPAHNGAVPTWINERLLSWASEIDEATVAQASRTAGLPFVVGHVALMPDAHLGLGATVGSVIPTERAIIPAAVGVDIGCGMIAVETGLGAGDLPDDLGGLLRRIERAVPAGVGRGHDPGRSGSLPGAAWLRSNPNRSVEEQGLEEKAVTQFGTLGSGNHFVEVCLDETQWVWVVLHSGSRGVGNRLAMHHIDVAKKIMSRDRIDLPDRDLAYLTEGTPEFDRYVADLLWAQRYALGNREAMMDSVLDALRAEVTRARGPERIAEVRRINCHHNYSAREHHLGREIWVTRKGAIRAGEGDAGVVPGSMGTSTFIVHGLGNPLSFHSAAHGAGRRMSRTQAKKQFTPRQLAAAMEGKTWLADRARSLLDEIPGSYKDIEAVMADQADLVTAECRLDQILNYKGT